MEETRIEMVEERPTSNRNMIIIGSVVGGTLVAVGGVVLFMHARSLASETDGEIVDLMIGWQREHHRHVEHARRTHKRYRKVKRAKENEARFRLSRSKDFGRIGIDTEAHIRAAWALEEALERAWWSLTSEGRENNEVIDLRKKAAEDGIDLHKIAADINADREPDSLIAHRHGPTIPYEDKVEAAETVAEETPKSGAAKPAAAKGKVKTAS